MTVDFAQVPPWLLIAVVLLALVQVTLAVVALVDLYRRPAAQVVSGIKPLWAVAILVLNIVGPVLYLAVGRRRPAGEDVRTAAPPARPADVAQALYPRRDKRNPA